MNMESIYEYGSRAGVWRLLRLFEQRKIPMTIFAVGMALFLSTLVLNILSHRLVARFREKYE